MIKIVVIDDEFLVREGIKRTIDWPSYGCEIVGEANNGQTGLNKILELLPDVVITDIKMPLLNGVELVNEIRRHHLDVAIIVLSGYKDFDYAKSVFENGTYSYLLKPIDNQTLVNTVLSAHQKQKALRQQQQVISDIQMDLSMVKDAIISQMLSNESNPASWRNRLETYQIPMPEMGTFLFIKMYENTDIEHLKKFSHFITEQFLNKKDRFFYHIYQNTLYMMLDTKTELKKQIHDVIKRYDEISNIPLFIMMEQYENLESISKMMVKNELKYKQCTYTGLSQVYFDNEAVVNYKPLVARTIKYIAEHFNEKITVKLLTDLFFVSESYLLHMFKDEIGISLNDYLTNYRIEVAKKLLKESKYKIYEVASMVGYRDFKYFSQVFKKIVGMSPSQYDEQQKTLRRKLTTTWLIVTIVLVLMMLLAARGISRYYIKSYLDKQIYTVQNKIDNGLTILLNSIIMDHSYLMSSFDFLFDTNLSELEKQTQFETIKETILSEQNYTDVVIITDTAYGDRDISDELELNDIIHTQQNFIYIHEVSSNGDLRIGLPYTDINGQIKGSIILYLGLTQVSNLLYTIDADLGTNYLINQENEILFANPYEMIDPIYDIDSDYQKINQEGSKLVFRSLLKETEDRYLIHLEVITVVDENTLYQDLNILDTLMVSLGVLIALLVAAIIIQMTNVITKPIEQLTKRIKSFQKEGEVVKVKTQNDEIYELEKTYDDMIDRIMELIEKNNEEQSKQRKLELDALQMQINPHFLYNTLDAIAWMAKIKGDKEIETLVLALAKFFRISLHKGDKFIKVIEEIELIQNFIQIELIRFPKKFTIDYQIEEDIKEVNTLKLILQPVVENAIKHGISGLEDEGHIVIKAYKDNEDIVYEIHDDGLGFDSEKKREDSVIGGYGLYNVNERIRLEYGDKYGLSINSKPNQGTHVTIRIPIRTN